MIKISPSILCADFSNLRKEIVDLDECGIDYFHFDICDGNFVPIISMGTDLVASLRKITKTPFDIHLQVVEPQKHISSFINAGANLIIFHIESVIDHFRIIRNIKRRDIKAGLALNPTTPLSYLDYIIDELDVVLIMTIDTGLLGQEFINQMLRKIIELKKRIESNRLPVEIMVDGNINMGTIPRVIEAGADILVLGTSGLFGIDADKKAVIEEIKKVAESVQKGANLIGF